MIGYVYTSHPVTGEPIAIVPTGKKENGQAEFLCISPGSNCERLWLQREEIFAE